MKNKSGVIKSSEFIFTENPYRFSANYEVEFEDNQKCYITFGCDGRLLTSQMAEHGFVENEKGQEYLRKLALEAVTKLLEENPKIKGPYLYEYDGYHFVQVGSQDTTIKKL
jgi:hypothetical protein